MATPEVGVELREESFFSHRLRVARSAMQQRALVRKNAHRPALDCC